MSTSSGGDENVLKVIVLMVVQFYTLNGQIVEDMNFNKTDII